MEPMILAEIANLSYENENTFKTEIVKFTNPIDILFFNACDSYSVDAQIYVLEYENEIIFSVRGTSSKHDVLSDLYTIKQKFSDIIFPVLFDNKNSTHNHEHKNIMVHSGFLQQYKALKFFVLSNVFKQIWNNSNKKSGDETTINTIPIKITFTSHSLGAAVSVLLSSLIKSHFGNKVYIVNHLFGCPKIGNKSFVNFYNDTIDETYRYVNKNDIITRIPKINYKTTKNRIILNDPSNANWFNRTFGNIKDHSMKKYIDRLKEANELNNADTKIVPEIKLNFTHKHRDREKIVEIKLDNPI